MRARDLVVLVHFGMRGVLVLASLALGVYLAIALSDRWAMIRIATSVENASAHPNGFEAFASGHDRLKASSIVRVHSGEPAIRDRDWAPPTIPIRVATTARAIALRSGSRVLPATAHATGHEANVP